LSILSDGGVTVGMVNAMWLVGGGRSMIKKKLVDQEYKGRMR
jgi:hypothetical protein